MPRIHIFPNSDLSITIQCFLYWISETLLVYTCIIRSLFQHGSIHVLLRDTMLSRFYVASYKDEWWGWERGSRNSGIKTFSRKKTSGISGKKERNWESMIKIFDIQDWTPLYPFFSDEYPKIIMFPKITKKPRKNPYKSKNISENPKNNPNSCKRLHKKKFLPHV